MPPSIEKPSHECSGRNSSLSKAERVSANRMDSVRFRLKNSGISDRVASIISKAQRDTTQISYGYAWNKWCSWCSERKIDPVPGSIATTTEFLTDLFREGLQVNTLGIYKASLSATLPYIDGFSIGNHPIMKELFKGFTNLRPREYKTLPNWEVDKVLETIITWGKNESLSLKKLTLKLAMLIALTSASRCSEITYLDIAHMTKLPEGIRFTLTRHKKNRSSAILPGMLFIPYITENKLLCPCLCLETYIQKTEKFRNGPQGAIFRKTIKPHTPVKPSTISKWITMVIVESGFTAYKAHSTRGKATSEAKNKGLSTKQVMMAAGWRSNSVFRHHYYHPQFNANFGRTVLLQQNRPGI